AYYTNMNNQATDSPYKQGGPAGTTAASSYQPSNWTPVWDVIVGFRTGATHDVLDFASSITAVAGESIGATRLDSALSASTPGEQVPNGLIWLGTTGSDSDAGQTNSARDYG